MQLKREEGGPLQHSIDIAKSNFYRKTSSLVDW